MVLFTIVPVILFGLFELGQLLYVGSFVLPGRLALSLEILIGICRVVFVFEKISREKSTRKNPAVFTICRNIDCPVDCLIPVVSVLEALLAKIKHARTLGLALRSAALLIS